MCKERKDLEIKEDYDILYTTGPDVVSEVFDKLDDKPKYLTKNECDEYFIHNHVGHWRKSYNRSIHRHHQANNSQILRHLLEHS